MTSLDIVELVMALEESHPGEKIGPGATLGDVHWRLVQKERERPGRRRSSDEIWSEIVKTLEEHGVPEVQIMAETRIEDLIS